MASPPVQMNRAKSRDLERAQSKNLERGKSRDLKEESAGNGQDRRRRVSSDSSKRNSEDSKDDKNKMNGVGAAFRAVFRRQLSCDTEDEILMAAQQTGASEAGNGYRGAGKVRNWD